MEKSHVSFAYSEKDMAFQKVYIPKRDRGYAATGSATGAFLTNLATMSDIWAPTPVQ
jgi:hypothetical protein